MILFERLLGRLGGNHSKMTPETEVYEKLTRTTIIHLKDFLLEHVTSWDDLAKLLELDPDCLNEAYHRLWGFSDYAPVLRAKKHESPLFFQSNMDSVVLSALQQSQTRGQSRSVPAYAGIYGIEMLFVPQSSSLDEVTSIARCYHRFKYNPGSRQRTTVSVPEGNTVSLPPMFYVELSGRLQPMRTSFYQYMPFTFVDEGIKMLTFVSNGRPSNV